MNLNENIQLNRKRLNISQEELGNMLCVSRQTISMWEKGNTVPTIDNLVRISEIFSISVDELLKGARDNTENNVIENYKFNFSTDELKEIISEENALVYKKPITFTVITVFVLLFFILTKAPGFLIGFALGMILIGTVSHIKGIIAYKKAWDKSFLKIVESTYCYQFHKDFFEIEITRENSTVKSYNIGYKNIENIIQFKNHYLLQVNGQIFIIRKNELRENSILYSYLYNNPSKIVKQAMPSGWRATSIILFILSLCSIFFALFLIGVVSEMNGLFIENTWLFYAVTPIPISSVIFGFIATHKGYKCKKNIIGGVIMTILLCVYGSFVFMF